MVFFTDLQDELVDLVTSSLDRTSVGHLCLVSKQFPKHCQPILFQDTKVDLRPELEYNEVGPWGQKSLPSTQARVVDMLSASPHLGKYIKNLAYRLPLTPSSSPCVDEPGALAALELMDRVADFTFIAGGFTPAEATCEKCQTPSSPSSASTGRLELFDDRHGKNHTRHAKAMLSIIQNPSLKRLTLVDAKIPAQALHMTSSHLECVTMRSSVCHPTEGWSTFLGALSGQSSATEPVSTEIEPAALQLPAFPACSKISFENATTPDRPGWDYQSLSILLERSPQLRNIHLETEMVQGRHRQGSPLQSLHPSSFNTLTHLSLSIHLDVPIERACIGDPYQGLVSDGVLQQLRALEELSIVIALSGRKLHRAMFAPGYDSRWGEIDRALAPDGQRSPDYPNFSSFSLEVNIDTESYWEPEAFENNYMYIEETIFEEQFGGLRKLGEDGVIQLTLEVENTMTLCTAESEEKEEEEESRREGEDDDEDDDNSS